MQHCLDLPHEEGVPYGQGAEEEQGLHCTYLNLLVCLSWVLMVLEWLTTVSSVQFLLLDHYQS